MTQDRRRTALAALLLLLAVLAAFGGALGNGFVWDDGAMIVDNPAVSGLGWANWRWMFGTLYLSSYMPLGWAAFAAVRVLAGLSPAAFHAANLAAHWLAAFALYLAARRLYERARLPGAALTAGAAALLFAVHPLQAASVPWAADLPDILAAACFLFAVRVYLGEGRRRLPATLALYAVSLLLRWTGIALPVVLVLLDWWPLRRRAFAEKLPFAALAALFVAANAAGKRAAGYAPAFMPLAAARGLCLYPWKLLSPSPVLPVYGLNDSLDTLGVSGWGCLALVVLLTAWLWLGRRRRPALLVAWLAYAAAVLPPLLNATRGAMLVFPKYAYLSCIPAFLLLAEGLRRLHARKPPAAAAAVALLLAVWLPLARRETACWRDSILYWTRAIVADPGCRVAYGNLAGALIDAGRYNDAYFYLSNQLSYNAGDPVARENMDYLRRRAPALRPDRPAFLVSVAGDFLALGRPADAERCCAQALRARPLFPEARACLERAQAGRAGR